MYLTTKLASHNMPPPHIYAVNVIDLSYSARYFQKKILITAYNDRHSSGCHSAGVAGLTYV